MICIIQIAFQLPEVGVHGTDTTCRVLLGEERSLVLRDLVQIVCTVPNSLAYGGETGSRLHLASRHRRAALHFLAEIQSVTIAAHRRCHAVRTQQHLLATVLTALRGLTQCAGYIVNSGTPSYFCHSRSAIGSHWKGDLFLGRLGLPARLPFSKCQVKALLHRSPHRKQPIAWFKLGTLYAVRGDKG